MSSLSKTVTFIRCIGDILDSAEDGAPVRGFKVPDELPADMAFVLGRLVGFVVKYEKLLDSKKNKEDNSDD